MLYICVSVKKKKKKVKYKTKQPVEPIYYIKYGWYPGVGKVNPKDSF